MRTQIREMLRNRLIREGEIQPLLPEEFRMEPKEAVRFSLENGLMLAKEEKNPVEQAEFEMALEEWEKIIKHEV